MEHTFGEYFDFDADSQLSQCLREVGDVDFTGEESSGPGEAAAPICATRRAETESNLKPDRTDSTVI